jgi:hypothetical protein
VIDYRSRFRYWFFHFHRLQHCFELNSGALLNAFHKRDTHPLCHIYFIAFAMHGTIIFPCRIGNASPLYDVDDRLVMLMFLYRSKILCWFLYGFFPAAATGLLI